MADRVVRMLGIDPGFSICPFRGEYFQLPAEHNQIVNHLIYPIPDPSMPFLGVHLTRMIDGSVTVGPNAVLALKREGYRKRDISLSDSWEMLTNPGILKVLKANLLIATQQNNDAMQAAVKQTAQRFVDPNNLSEGMLNRVEAAIAVLETLMHELGLRIEKVTDTFDDPAQVYAYGIRAVLDTAITDVRWTQMLNRSEVIADAMFRVMGHFAIRDLRLASQAGRFEVSNAELVWRLTTHALVGAGHAITTGRLPASASDQIIVRLLCMTGIGANAAVELSARPRPALWPERGSRQPVVPQGKA